MKLLAKTIFGLENVLAEEIRNLGGLDVKILNRAVTFKGDKHLLYASNLHLRTALNILVPITDFIARDEFFLYKGIQDIDWSKYLSLEKTFAINTVVNSPIFTHSQYVGYKVKDAIVDQFRDKTGNRPNIDSKTPDIKINIHIDNKKVTVSMDSSGDPLNRRGYRMDTNEAPLNEVLAAGMLQIAGWNGNSNLVDPMCGSGTLSIEAAMLAYNIAAGKNRSHYAFMNWPDFDAELWNQIREKAIAAEKESIEYGIYTSDKSRRTIQFITEKNVNAAGLSDKLNLVIKSIENLEAPVSEGIVIMNPPYGERMRELEINNMYKMIGDNLKHKFQGFDAWIISSNSEAMKNVGLKASTRIKLFNGSLECRFNKYELYEGSKKMKKQTKESV